MALRRSRRRRWRQGIEEALFHFGEVVGEDGAVAVDVVERRVLGAAGGAGGGGAAEEPILDLREVLGDDRAAAVDVALEDGECASQGRAGGACAGNGDGDAVAVGAARS